VKTRFRAFAFVSGHDFSRAATGLNKSGTLAPAVLKGHGFSRAVSRQNYWALATEGCSAELIRHCLKAEIVEIRPVQLIPPAVHLNEQWGVVVGISNSMFRQKGSGKRDAEGDVNLRRRKSSTQLAAAHCLNNSLDRVAESHAIRVAAPATVGRRWD